MSTEERRRLQMAERFTQTFGADVADTVLAHLPPTGEQVATAAQLEQVRAELRTEMQQAFELQTQALTSAWRRDLLLVITGQFVALAGVLTAIT